MLGYTAGKGVGEPVGDDTVVFIADRSSVGLYVLLFCYSEYIVHQVNCVSVGDADTMLLLISNMFSLSLSGNERDQID